MSEQDNILNDALPQEAAPCIRSDNDESCGKSCRAVACPGVCGSCSDKAPRGKLFGTNWLSGISDASDYDIVEVQFKNTRKGFYRNSARLDLHIGDMVAVEANPGHDIGQITMVGRLVDLHIKKSGIKPDYEYKKVFRIARESDLEKFAQARSREHDTMIRSRKIAEDLQLDMKIGDVEYQGDGLKAIFYYIADERVDFRKLIRVLADTFKVRIEMKQIGARQEAGRIGGIGPCGRPLCCSSWMTNFVSVGTAVARYQDLSMNPQKLAGQCAKLKCCLNFEADCYVEASRQLPSRDIPLETLDATYFHFKTDILTGRMTYSTDKNQPVNLVTIPMQRVEEIIAVNKRGEKVKSLLEESQKTPPQKEFVELVGQDNINRFDKSRKKKKKQANSSSSDPSQKAVSRDDVGSQLREQKKSPAPERNEKPSADKQEKTERPAGKQAKQRRKRQAQKPDAANEQRPPRKDSPKPADSSRPAKN